ncbi:MAG: phosphomannomutase [Gammaproteobacteria bacterium]|nr:MAG: phosphomannomutase [Gammaproteobacteria bacterium]
MTELTCFKAYDVRGRIPDQINEEIAFRIGRAYAEIQSPKKVIVGHDIRLTSVAISKAVSDGLRAQGVDVYDIGECGTEEVYFATFDQQLDGGIMVTASHNPKDYNGMKFVREGSRPISGDTGLFDIKSSAERQDFQKSSVEGKLIQNPSETAYIKHLLTYVDNDQLKPLKIVCNAGNGGAGKVVDLLEPHLPFEFVKVHHQADGEFPNGVPNPLLKENRGSTIDAIKASKADLGIAWDGDFDRCFFFDENGRFIEGYYIVGLLAESFLRSHPGSKVIHDPRLIWNTIDIANQFNGQAIQSKTGHAFIKERMRKEDAIYGGEMSAHHYFRDFAYCDSGMIPWLLVAGLISQSGKSLSALVEERMASYPSSGEINLRLSDPKAAIDQVEKAFKEKAASVDYTDGLSMGFGQWRFNLRMSNTEPVVRLNVESKGDQALMERQTEALLAMLER